MSVTLNNTLNKEKTAYARASSIKTSVQKLNLVGKLIAGMKVDQALLQLQFCKKGVAKHIAAVLNSAIANAENNKSLDVDNLYVSEVKAGKAFKLKRFHPRARGRSGKINKPFSNLTIFVSERG